MDKDTPQAVNEASAILDEYRDSIIKGRKEGKTILSLNVRHQMERQKPYKFSLVGYLPLMRRKQIEAKN